jgi:ribose 5-phosphate isomerase B
VQFKKIGLAADHAGRELKIQLKQFLIDNNIPFHDFGVADEREDSVDYPDYAAQLAQAVSRGEVDGGIAICGSGIGMAITANKFPGVRAVSAWDNWSTSKGREHNNSNVLCLASRQLSISQAIEMVHLWLMTPYVGDRHDGRLEKIRRLEEENFKKT